MSVMGLLSKANVKDDWTKTWIQGGRLLILEGKQKSLLFQVALVALQLP